MKTTLDFKAIASQCEDTATLLELMNIAQDLVLTEKTKNLFVIKTAVLSVYQNSSFPKDDYEFLKRVTEWKSFDIVRQAQGLVDGFIGLCQKVNNKDNFFAMYDDSFKIGFMSVMSAIGTSLVEDTGSNVDYLFALFLKYSEIFEEYEAQTFLASVDMVGRGDLIHQLEEGVKPRNNMAN